VIPLNHRWARRAERFLRVPRFSSVRSREGAIQFHLGVVDQLRGKLEEAKRYLRQALALDGEAGGQEFEAADLARLGEVLRQLGRLDEAAEYLQQAHALFDARGDWESDGEALYSLGRHHPRRRLPTYQQCRTPHH
jgi:tetratricopeptide (TPR) repeat protein